MRRHTLGNTTSQAGSDPLGYACDLLLSTADVRPAYDLILMDEGQDFAPGFSRLCYSLAKESRFVMAYDELQNLFQPSAPNATQIFVNKQGEPLGVSFTEDVILRTCYRNPREILIVAHAVGLGIYGTQIVQILESQQHWEAVGYELTEGQCIAGSRCVLNRPEDTSLTVVSSMSGSFDDIVSCYVFDTIDEELDFVVASVQSDLREGISPEDILVVCVDDRNSKAYLKCIENLLVKQGIGANNIHDAAFGLRDFSVKGQVTLSTVHKAKGNEAYMVYVVGVDAPMRYAQVRQRNMLFTAMTRAKAWLKMSGVGDEANLLAREVASARTNYPRLDFLYPSSQQIEIIKSHLEKESDSRGTLREIASLLAEGYSNAEIAELMAEIRKRQGRMRKSPRDRRAARDDD